MTLSVFARPETVDARLDEYTVDVWHFTAGHPNASTDTDWRRYRVTATDGTEASLIACQMAWTHGHVADFVVTDWP